MAEKIYYEGAPDIAYLPFLIGKYIFITLLICMFLGPLSAIFLVFPVFAFLFGTILSIGLLLFAIVYPILLLKTYKYKVTQNGVSFEGGILTRVEKNVPFYKITDIIVSQNIIARIFGLWNIGIQTAGQGAHSLAEIHFFGIKEPKKVKSIILKLMNKYQGAGARRGD